MEQLYPSLQPTSPSGTVRRTLKGALLTGLLGLSLAASAQSQNALNLNGSSTYVDANSVTLTGPLSIEAWVKVNAFKAASPFISSVAGVETGNNAAMLRFGDAGVSPNKLQFVLTVGTTQRKLVSTTTFAINTWYHLAGTYDGTDLKIYVNGVLDATLNAPSSTASPVIGTGVFSIGRNYENLRVLNGSIDEVRVWTRALTATEIATNSCSVNAAATGLEGYWKLNEGTGTTAADATGHGHTGTLIGTSSTFWSTTIPTACITTTATRAGVNASGLQVQVLGSPVHGSQATIEVRGTQGQPTTVQVLNMLGSVVLQRELKPSTAAQQSQLPLPAAAGLYVVRVRTHAGTATTRLLKQ